jgi:hypothetical protein
MSVINLLIILGVIIVGFLLYNMIDPSFYKKLLNSIQPAIFAILPIQSQSSNSQESKEGFNPAKNILKVVGKEPLSPNTLYINDYDTGNAKRYTSSLPSVINGGFSMPDSYYFYPVPDYKQGYELAVMDSPRSSEYNRGSHNDAVQIYYQNLYGTMNTK